MYLVIAQPGQRRSADLSLPGVALGLLRQSDMRAQQRMHGNAEATLRPIFHTIAVVVQVTMCPGRQRRVKQAPSGIEHREVQCGARTVQIREQAAESVRQRLLAPHAGQCGHRHADAAGGLLDGVGQQRVW